MVRVEPEENASENGQSGNRRNCILKLSGRNQKKKCILKWSGRNQKKKMHIKMVKEEQEENPS